MPQKMRVSNCQFFSLERCNKAHWDPAFIRNVDYFYANNFTTLLNGYN
ncbi:hypothetical protein [Wolbachia endosymbiont (group B) of Ischnura elegans]|nr:hypothetical protein [Wolbachia endosymbiont (group B) of Ischnura elegans]